MGLPPVKLLLVAISVSLGGSFHFGYQLVITNPTQEIFIQFVNQSHHNHYGTHLSRSVLEAAWSVIVALFFVGAIFGAFILRMVAEKVGRHRGLYVSMSLGIIALIITIVSHATKSYEVYVMSRILLGCSVAMSLGLSALYFSEASPKHCRGTIGMITGSIVQVGTVGGAIVALPQLCGTTDLWIVMYYLELILMVLSMISLLMMPESPAFLVKKERLEQAKKSIEFFHGCGEKKADVILNDIMNEQASQTSSVGMVEVLSRPQLRRRAVIGMVVAFSSAFSGVAVINAFAVDILESAGLTRLEASIANVGFGMISLVAIFAASIAVEKFGRRSLLLLANSSILFTNLVIISLMYIYNTYKIPFVGYLLIIAIGIFIVFFAIGPGPLLYFISAELVGVHGRSAAQSWTSVVQMTCRACLLSIFLPLKSQVGNAFAYLILFVGPVILALAFLYFRLPETKNKTTLEVDEAEKKLPSFSRAFRRNCSSHQSSSSSLPTVVMSSSKSPDDY